MQLPTYKSALIVGAGAGLSASLTRLLRGEGLAVAIAARDGAKLARLCAETGAQAFTCDAQDEAQVRRLFVETEDASGPLDVVIYNASARTWGLSSDSYQPTSSTHCRSLHSAPFSWRSKRRPGWRPADTELSCLRALRRA